MSQRGPAPVSNAARPAAGGIKPLELVLSKLQGVTGPNAAGWNEALCPSHDDRRRSLGVKAGETDAVILKCQAGCTTEAVVSALGLTMEDLFPATGRQGRGRIVEEYNYVDEAGTLLSQVCRLEPKSFRQRRPNGNGGWTWRLDGVRRVLYRLPELLTADLTTRVYLVEGEKDADALRGLGIVATTNAGGAGKWRPEYTAALRGRPVVIVPDNDDAGRQHAEQVAADLAGVAASVRVLELPDLPPKGDVSDWLAAGGTRAQLEALALAVPVWQPSASSKDTTPPAPGKRGPSQATQLVELAEDLELFHTSDGDAYADLRIGGHRETHALRSRALRDYLARRYYLAHRRAASGEAVREALDVLAGRARWECPERTVAVRVAGDDQVIYVDLADASWRVVEVTRGGWRVLDEAPVRFRRPRGMLALPEPTRGGSVDDLRPLLNLARDVDWVLIVAWLVAALRPQGPYPVLALHGEAGTAKSSMARILRSCIDPNRAPLRATPREERDIIIAASNGWVIALDNLSSVSAWLSDSLCRLATGGGYSARELYSDLDEVLVDVQRPALLNAIEDVAVRGDLADRKIAPQLPVIPDEQRQGEADLWAAVDRARPAVLGALLDAVACGLHNLPAVHLARKPRMADFAMWGVACEPALGWTDGTFLAAYEASRREAADGTLESSAVGAALLAVLDGGAIWEGTAATLLETLTAHVSDAVRRDKKRWPQSARGLAGTLRRLAPALRASAIEVDFYREGHEHTRRVRVSTVRTDRTDRTDERSRGYGAETRTDADGSAEARRQPSAAPPGTFAGDSARPDGADDADGSRSTLWGDI